MEELEAKERKAKEESGFTEHGKACITCIHYMYDYSYDEGEKQCQRLSNIVGKAVLTDLGDGCECWERIW